MGDNRETTIEDVRYMCRRGAFRAYTKGGDIYLEDGFTRETVKLNEGNEQEQAENEPTRPVTTLRAQEKRTPHGGRTARMFGSEPRPRHDFHDEEGPYKGFLFIKCEECGKVKAFCARRETYGFHCDECGAETPLEKLRPMHLHCKCGKEFRYKTNITDKRVTHTCISCHAPVDMELNGRGTAYVTIEGERK